MTDRFDWNTDDSVVVRPHAAIAVARGPDGEVMLRQEGQYCISEDQFIDVAPEHVVTVCKAMLRAAGLHSMMIVPVGEIELVGRHGNRMKLPASELEKLDRIAEETCNEERWPARPRETAQAKRPKDPGAAARKRRQREAARDSVTEPITVTRDTVTSERDTATVTEPVTPQQPFLRLAR